MTDFRVTNSPSVGGYALAVALAVVALVFRGLFPAGFGLGIYTLALVAILVSTSYAGRGPGWATTLISLVGIRYFFISPTHSLSIPSWQTAVGLLLFVAVSVLVVEFSMARRRSEQAFAESERRFRLLAENVDVEYRIVRPDGTTRWIHDRGVLIKEIEDRLRTSEEHWKQAFENNPTMYFVLDATGRILSVNSYGAEQLGYSVEELAGRRVADLFDADDRERAVHNVASSLEHPGASSSFELRKLRRDGTVIWLRGTAKAVTGPGDTRTVLVACEDVTHARVAAEELRYKTQLLATITDNASTMLHMHDEHGRAVFVNPAMERITGYPAEELIGQVVHDKIHHSKPDGTPYAASECRLHRLVRLGEPVQAEEVFVRKDGTFFPVVYSARPVFHDGKPRGAVVEMQDISERKKTEQALVELQAELAHVTRLTTLDELAASIAHEINQPLAAVVADASAALRWLAARPPELEEARQAAARIVNEGNRAGEIISRMRALVRKAPSRRDWVDLNEAIKEVVALTRAEAQKAHVTLGTHLAKDAPPVVADRIQLQQVIVNLVLNGIESSAAAEGPREVVVTCERDGSDGVKVSVCDSGLGFDAASADRLFDAFYSTKRDGMGIGLAISRSIVESHCGRIWAAPNESRGSVLQFTIPAGPRPNAPGGSYDGIPESS
jgi:PAS domain S-box-containing protein